MSELSYNMDSFFKDYLLKIAPDFKVLVLASCFVQKQGFLVVKLGCSCRTSRMSFQGVRNIINHLRVRKKVLNRFPSTDTR